MPRWLQHVLAGLGVYAALIGLLALMCRRAPMDPNDSNTREDKRPRRRRTDLPPDDY